MPSYVSFPADGTAITGQNAKDQLTINPESTIFNLPRLIGLDFDDAALQSEIKSLPFKVIDKNNKPYIQISTNQDEKELAPEQASSIILSELKKKAEKHLGESVTHAIVTVPSSFNDAQRRAIMTAGSIANLKIMRLINESTAAAIGSNNNTISRKSNVLVFKLGSGTFDVRPSMEMNLMLLRLVAIHTWAAKISIIELWNIACIVLRMQRIYVNPKFAWNDCVWKWKQLNENYPIRKMHLLK